MNVNININGDAVKEILSKLALPDFVKEFLACLGDEVRAWRYLNQVKILMKTKDLLKSKKINSVVPLKLLVPLLQYSSLEEQENMQNMWAGLLASSAISYTEIKISYVEILKQLSPMEVQILDHLYKAVKVVPNHQFNKKIIIQSFEIVEDDFNLLIDNLFRLHLCQYPGSKTALIGNTPFLMQSKEFFELTILGFDLVKTCKLE